MRKSIKSLRSELKRLEGANKRDEERRNLKKRIFQERYKRPLSGLKSFAKGASGFGMGMEKFASNLSHELQGRSKSKKGSKNKPGKFELDLGI